MDLIVKGSDPENTVEFVDGLLISNAKSSVKLSARDRLENDRRSPSPSYMAIATKVSAREKRDSDRSFYSSPYLSSSPKMSPLMHKQDSVCPGSPGRESSMTSFFPMIASKAKMSPRQIISAIKSVQLPKVKQKQVASRVYRYKV
jgi:hypothetical protein